MLMLPQVKYCSQQKRRQCVCKPQLEPIWLLLQPWQIMVCCCKNPEGRFNAAKLFRRPNSELVHSKSKFVSALKLCLRWQMCTSSQTCCKSNTVLISYDKPRYQIWYYKNLLPVQQKILTLEMIQQRYPQTSWTHAYTDGSAENAVRNGGSGGS